MKRSANMIWMLILATVMLVDVAAAQSSSQTSTRTVNFEIISVNGNTIVYKDQTDATKGKALADFIWWALHDGEGMAKDLVFAPLLPFPYHFYSFSYTCLRSGKTEKYQTSST